MTRRRSSSHARRAAAFTLIEVLGAFFMTTVVLFLVTGIFAENGRRRSAASEKLRVATTAAATLDLVAQDLEGAVFVSPPAGRPARTHPWTFFAEGNGDLGATYLRFQTQNVPRSNLGENASTWVDVAYFLTEEEPPERGFYTDPSYTLWRWRSSRPPSEAARRAPDQDDLGSARVAEGLAAFGLTFVAEDGSTFEEWDSTFTTRNAPCPSPSRSGSRSSRMPGKARPKPACFRFQDGSTNARSRSPCSRRSISTR